MSNHAPEGWHSITPRIVCHDNANLCRFLVDVFDATGEIQSEQPTVLEIGDSKIMISGVAIREQKPAFLYVYVKDADLVYDRAMAAGAKSLEAPSTMHYGDRRCMIEDAWGNTWQIAHR